MGGTVALIPCREGSKRVMGKNGRKLGGQRLFVWSIDTALELGLKCYLSSDSWIYMEEAALMGATPINRPRELATDEAVDYDVISHALSVMSDKPELLVYLRPTTPFREADIVERAIRIMQEDPSIPSLRSVEEMGESAYKCFEMGKGQKLQPIFYWDSHGDYESHDMTDEPNQKVEPTYKANGYVDIIRSACLVNGYLWGEWRYGLVTPRTVEIDTEEDWERAEYWWAKGWNNK